MLLLLEVKVAPVRINPMAHLSNKVDHLISVPFAMTRHFEDLCENVDDQWHIACDPAGSQLGSAGGTVYLLVDAWRKNGGSKSFLEWLRSSRKLIVHGGGRSRRLPAYSPCGKPFIPIPVTRSSVGERLDQTLIDFQFAGYRRILEAAPENIVAMVTSGDVLLRFDPPRSPIPQTDVVCFGMTVEPEIAQDFGVFFTDGNESKSIEFMMQKPTVDEIVVRSSKYPFLIDTGMWLLSERAVIALFAKSGWDAAAEKFPSDGPNSYDMYGEFGLALGEHPSVPDSELADLTSSVFPLNHPTFLHLGTNRQLIEAVSHLQSDAASKIAPLGSIRHPDIYIENAIFDPPVRRDANSMLWIENSIVGPTWKVAHHHVLTGIPANEWHVVLEPGTCIDFVPIGDQDFAVRVYGFDDKFSGEVGCPDTRWLGRSVTNWLMARGLSLGDAGIHPNTDIHDAPLFPVMSLDDIDGPFLEWLCASDPEQHSPFSRLWSDAARVSAQDLNQDANLSRLTKSRKENRLKIVPQLQKNAQGSIFYRLDLDATATLIASSDLDQSNSLSHATAPVQPGADPLLFSKAAMYRAAILRRHALKYRHIPHRNYSELIAEAEEQAFDYLRASLVNDDSLQVSPVIGVLEDQIVWGRSPIRLDLAGGWTDTPPYCLAHGGKVVNIAVDLNGQPPIQVYAKPSKDYEIVIRSIDLGIEQRIRTFDDLNSYAQPGSEFALAKAALALAGFLPRFNSERAYSTLHEQLREFGSGIEVSMVAAIPAGSGLGTSSILAATLLGTLSSLCRLNWSRADIVHRVLVVEQMLTTGGGWQDQVGGMYEGLKLCETGPGMSQQPTVRWLPESLFSQTYSNSRILLYYTGITRMAKNILQDIVRGMFLNRSQVIDTLSEIARNATSTANAIQLGDYSALFEAVRRSWELNQRLDAGTNPPEVQAIFDRLQGETIAGKLLGAGGGGFLLLLANDSQTGIRIREKLTNNPLNPRARMVDISTSQVGLTVTKS